MVSQYLKEKGRVMFWMVFPIPQLFITSTNDSYYAIDIIFICKPYILLRWFLCLRSYTLQSLQISRDAKKWEYEKRL